jgi:hypothetical protein
MTKSDPDGDLLRFEDEGGLPEKEAPEPTEAEDAPSEDAETVTLVAASLPFFVTSFVLPQEDGGTLSFDSRGTEVPTEDADRLTEDAARNGVALTRKAN